MGAGHAHGSPRPCESRPASSCLSVQARTLPQSSGIVHISAPGVPVYDDSLEGLTDAPMRHLTRTRRRLAGVAEEHDGVLVINRGLSRTHSHSPYCAHNSTGAPSTHEDGCRGSGSRGNRVRSVKCRGADTSTVSHRRTPLTRPSRNDLVRDWPRRGGRHRPGSRRRPVDAISRPCPVLATADNVAARAALRHREPYPGTIRPCAPGVTFRPCAARSIAPGPRASPRWRRARFGTETPRITLGTNDSSRAIMC